MPENASAGAKIATVKCAYITEKEGELSAGEGDELEVLEQLDEYVKAKNAKTGLIGLIPSTHILFISKPPPKAGASMNVKALYNYKATEEGEMDFGGN